MCDFSSAKVGDRVWHVMWGWGSVIDMRHFNKQPVIVQFKSNQEEFRTDGTLYANDLYPSLFWDEVKIIPPPKPKRKAKKVIAFSLTVNVDLNGIPFLYSPSLFYRAVPELSGRQLGEPIQIFHEYEVEE